MPSGPQRGQNPQTARVARRAWVTYVTGLPAVCSRHIGGGALGNINARPSRESVSPACPRTAVLVLSLFAAPRARDFFFFLFLNLCFFYCQNKGLSIKVGQALGSTHVTRYVLDLELTCDVTSTQTSKGFAHK